MGENDSKRCDDTGAVLSAQDRSRMQELSDILTKASEAYYARDTELISNLEYDRLYDELSELEGRTGVILAGSPTISVGYEAADELPKERHDSPMLSLGKTKDREELRNFLGEQDGLLSWKMDGLTVVLTYENGSLSKAVTRGNGEIGEVITSNARVFKNIPLSIPYRGTLILRGEAVIRYSDFNKINDELEAEAVKEGKFEDVRYKNPRNLCSGSVRQLNNAVTAKRNVRFYAFSLVQANEIDFEDSREGQFLFLQEQGFEIVPYLRVNAASVVDAVADFENKIEEEDVPSDGLVLLMDSISYGESLGTTAKFPRNAIAFKWADELKETVLRDIEWSASRTGLINPVAIFDPVELEGTTVQRASVHNISIVKELELGIGDHITVYKANMIIPQIADNLTRSGNIRVPDRCPICGEKTQRRKDNDSEVLICVNQECPAKKLKSYALFVSRNAMNIDGLSEMTLEKLIGLGLIHEYADLYHLSQHRDEVTSLDGFGERSFNKLMDAIERSKETSLLRFIYAIGIPGIGVANARGICDYFEDDLSALLSADASVLAGIEGVGDVLAASIVNFLSNEKNKSMIEHLVQEVTIVKREISSGAQALAGLTFVITGKVHKFANRDELKAKIVELGGKATGSVSAKTDYLINNDVTSTSGKNKKAKELGVKIISEDDFIKLIEAH